MPGPPAPTSATRIIAGRYQVGELLGRGGMAEVYAGTDLRLDRPVAVKLLRPEMAARAEIRTRFEAEARAAASLSHPNAVGVYDTGEDDGVPFIIMERLPGDTLADRIAAGPVDPRWLRTVAAEVLGALSASHAVGLVHRDVKPGNILLAADGRAKVADFGIAKSAEAGAVDITTTGQLLGTPAYLAPERLDGAPATPGTDLWALGVVLYEALTRAKPYAGDTPLAIARAVAAGEHRPLSEVRPDLDPALVAAVERAMAHDPADRFASADDMAAALAPAPSPATGVPADTVDAAPDGTLVLGDADLPAAAGEPEAVAARAPQGDDKVRRLVIGTIVAAIAVLVLVLAVRAGSGGDPTPQASTSPSTTVATASAPTTAPTPTAGLSRQLRDTATKLGTGDGPMAATVAARLRSLADQVDQGGGGGEATALLASTVGWQRAGLLSEGAASSVVQLLAQVPGVSAAVVNALSGRLTTTPTTVAGKDRNGKAKGGNDE